MFIRCNNEILEEVILEHSIPAEARSRLINIVGELEYENKLLRENYKFYKNIVNNLMRMTEQIRHLKFKDDSSGEIQAIINRIYDSVAEIKDSEEQKFVEQYLVEREDKYFENK